MIDKETSDRLCVRQDNAKDAFNRLYEVVQVLRCPDGCPWDREQTPVTMRADLIEEVFEAVDAITQNDSEHAKEELGDVMLNTTMIAYMYEQEGAFAVKDVFNELCDKLIRRHPHVFWQSEGKSQADKPVSNAGEVLSQWDKIKANVEGRGGKCILDEVPDGFPPLLKAYKYQKKAAKKGFDWGTAEGAKAKITEELLEVEEAQKNCNENDSASLAHLEEEAGDLLFAAVNYIRKLGVNPDVALARCNEKFYRRFSYVQKKMEETDQQMIQENLDVMDSYWNEAKKNEK
ncbi:MAG: nucleoside triphosphate pyrophosphohydrolase [Treponema sp.]|nr:nucleoside triphosphate pyrophosphohydrolase [Treponema sp.]